jgi:excinuclease UvrABC nuclease subunit
MRIPPERQAELAALPHVVYIARNHDGQALYVGMTYKLGQRMEQHRTQSAWHRNLASVDTIPFDDRRSARLGEAATIRAEEPLHNRLRMRRTTPLERSAERQAVAS